MNMIQTIKGPMNEDLLEMRVIHQDGSDEVRDLVATEYWFEGELVKRDLTGVLIGRDLGSVQQSLGA